MIDIQKAVSKTINEIKQRIETSELEIKKLKDSIRLCEHEYMIISYKNSLSQCEEYLNGLSVALMLLESNTRY